METTADLQHKIDAEEIEINPRTGQPYKTSPAQRKAKAKWSKKNPEASRAAVYRWIDNNRDRWNEMCNKNQKIYNAKIREEVLYFRELFTEAIV
jgi:hypothetical protein